MGSKKLLPWLRQFAGDERGQSTTEYILILAVVVLIVSKFRVMITDKLGQATNQIGQKITDELSNIQ